MVQFRLACPVLCFVGVAAAQATSTATNDPSATSTPTLVQQALNYNPSKLAAGIFAGLYGIVTLVLFFRLFAHRSWWGLCLPIGAAFMTAGFAIRILMIQHPNSLVFYLCSTLFILLSPTAFLAFDYILYGRLAVSCIPPQHSLIRPERTARYFILSDVATFLVQAIGGSFLTSTDTNTDRVGIYITIGGLALQTLSFVIYVLLVRHVYWSLVRAGAKPFGARWGVVLKMLFFSSAFFLLRCIYRTVEFAQGLGNGYLASHEVFPYVFDSLSLLVGITPYAVRWPSQYLEPLSDLDDETSADITLDPTLGGA